MSSFVTYVGVADCHGIESFQLKDDTSDFDRTCRIMRSAANGQRHAVYYEASMEAAAASVVKEFLDDGQYTEALECLKRVSIELSTLPEQAASLEKIPNPELDPYA